MTGANRAGQALFRSIAQAAAAQYFANMNIRPTRRAIALAVFLCGSSLYGEQPRPGTLERVVSLQTNILSDAVPEISFPTRPGFVYRIEQSSNSVWKTWQRIVADAEKFDFIPTEEASYRVFQEDGRIQFPDWFDRIQQYLRFDVWTPVKGTYRMELYGDGALVYTTNNTIPSHGHLGVHDSNYDPTQWPNAGYYKIGLWELRVTVMPTNGSDTPLPTTTSVQKIGTSNRRFPVFKNAIIRETPFPGNVITNAPRR